MPSPENNHPQGSPQEAFQHAGELAKGLNSIPNKETAEAGAYAGKADYENHDSDAGDTKASFGMAVHEAGEMIKSSTPQLNYEGQQMLSKVEASRAATDAMGAEVTGDGRAANVYKAEAIRDIDEARELRNLARERDVEEARAKIAGLDAPTIELPVVQAAEMPEDVSEAA